MVTTQHINRAGAAVDPMLRIGDLARRVGKSTRAVRLYEELGLLGPTDRTHGGHRVYGRDALVRLGWIDRLQVLGMSLAEIRAFVVELDGETSGPAAMERARCTFEAKLRDVRAQIDALQQVASELEDGLAYLETCNTACALGTDRVACASCGHDHSVDAPVLIQGIHANYEGK